MRPLGVVLLLPGVDNRSCLRQAPEPVQIQTLIPKLAVEALDMAILCRFPWLDEVECDAIGVGPGVQRPSGELRAVVDGDLLGRAIIGHELIQDPRHPLARQGGIDLERQTLAGHPIQYVQRSEATSVDEHIVQRSCLKSMLQASPRCQIWAPAPRGGTATRLRLRRRSAKRSSR
jgi:hypothetical protein